MSKDLLASMPMPRRRGLCLLPAALLLGTSRAAPVLDERSIAPKFNPDGTEARWTGNSIICHVDKRSETFMALLDIHRGLMRSGMLHRIAVLPPASYHMTIFNGISYPERQMDFPSDIPRDADEAFCNAWFLAKLKAFDLGCELPLRLRALPVQLQTNLYNIQYEPVDPAEARKIQRLRDRLAAVLNYRRPDHGHFRFHITLNYFYSPMTSEEEKGFARLHQDLAGELIRRSPVLELQAPEYVVFDGMYEFRTEWMLENKATGRSTTP